MKSLVLLAVSVCSSFALADSRTTPEQIDTYAAALLKLSSAVVCSNFKSTDKLSFEQAASNDLNNIIIQLQERFRLQLSIKELQLSAGGSGGRSEVCAIVTKQN